MNSFLVLSFLLGTVWSAVPNRPLISELMDFMEVIPTNRIMEITTEHFNNDPEFGAAIVYLQSPEWEELNNKVMESQEYQDLRNRLLNLGIPIDLMHRLMKNMLFRATPGKVGDTPNLEPYLTDIENALPFDKIIIFANKKLENSENFRALYDGLASKETYKIVERLRANPDVKRMITQLTKMGVRVNDMIELAYSFFNWGSPF